MGNLHPQDIPLLWCATFVSELHKCGLRHVVISPGSRSTPLVLAFAQHKGIRKHIVLDERSAAFVALGIGIESGQPAALVCTSGSAVANYFPAVVEAKMSGTPLLILSADRPPMNRNTGANQTINQDHFFGDYSVFFADPGEPRNTQQDMEYLRSLASQAYMSGLERKGPSHVNFPFRKPFEPSAETLHNLPDFYFSDATHRPNPVVSTHSQRIWKIPTEIRTKIESSDYPIAVCGPRLGERHLGKITELLKSIGIPVLQEAGSIWQSDQNIDKKNRSEVASDLKQNALIDESSALISGFNTFLQNDKIRKNLKPDLIIRIGAFPVGKGAELFLEEYKSVETILFTSSERYSNPIFARQLRVATPNFDQINPVWENSEIEAIGKKWQSWHQNWKRLSDVFVKKRNEIIAGKNREKPAYLTDGEVYDLVAKYIGDHDLMVSSSFPARDVDMFGMPGLSGRNIYMNRGASGIDGVSSTALGIAVASYKPTVLITGDLAFLHDANALLSLKKFKEAKLTIIVINNSGGSIFRMLPVAEKKDFFNFYFETPQEADITRICGGFGLACKTASNAESLEEVLKNHDFRKSGVIECITNPDDSMKLRKAVRSIEF